MAIEYGCGDGKKSRTRTRVESESECQVREEDKLMEEKECFTKHCTNEFYINNIKVQVLEAEYPGTFWVKISCHKINSFSCHKIYSFSCHKIYFFGAG